jgi:hypothetical protein
MQVTNNVNLEPILLLLDVKFDAGVFLNVLTRKGSRYYSHSRIPLLSIKLTLNQSLTHNNLITLQSL